MLQRKNAGCEGCIESSSCEFSSEFCPRAALDQCLDEDLSADPVLKKYRDLYKKSGG